ncbi:MAG: hypothetical protein ACK4XY_08420 [Chloroherpetonaceae bacterium]
MAVKIRYVRAFGNPLEKNGNIEQLWLAFFLSAWARLALCLIPESLKPELLKETPSRQAHIPTLTEREKEILHSLCCRRIVDGTNC